MINDNLFSIDDLFVTVRDSQLRALNRIIFIENLKETVPKVARLYIRVIRDTDPMATREIEKIKRQINKYGVCSIRTQLKYRINPYEEHEVETCSKHSLPLYRPFS